MFQKLFLLTFSATCLPWLRNFFKIKVIQRQCVSTVTSSGQQFILLCYPASSRRLSLIFCPPALNINGLFQKSQVKQQHVSMCGRISADTLFCVGGKRDPGVRREQEKNDCKWEMTFPLSAIPPTPIVCNSLSFHFTSTCSRSFLFPFLLSPARHIFSNPLPAPWLSVSPITVQSLSQNLLNMESFWHSVKRN